MNPGPASLPFLLPGFTRITPKVGILVRRSSYICHTVQRLEIVSVVQRKLLSTTLCLNNEAVNDKRT